MLDDANRKAVHGFCAVSDRMHRRRSTVFSLFSALGELIIGLQGHRGVRVALPGTLAAFAPNADNASDQTCVPGPVTAGMFIFSSDV